MKSNSSKLRTISSFFSSSPTKKRKINDQIPNSSSTSAATGTILSETSNLLSTIDSSGSADVDSLATCDHSVSKLSSSKISSLSPTSLRATAAFSSLSINISHSLPDPSLQLVSSSIPSSLLPIDTHCSTVDVLSKPVSSSISLTSSSLLPVDTRPELTDAFSEPASPSIPSSLSPIDIHCLTADVLLESVSPSVSLTSSTSPALLPIDTLRSSTGPFSQPASPLSILLSSVPLDISRSSADPPTQPILPSYKINNETRSFQKQWFVNRPWLEYSIDSDRVYCYYCRHFGSTNNMINRNQSDIFLKGFNNWKVALEKKKGLKLHETSAAHLIAASNYKESLLREKLKLNVINVVGQGRLEQIRKNRERLIKIASTVLLCGRQMISLRGHNEHEESNNRGNFLEILTWCSQTDLVVKSIFDDSTSNATYLSPCIQNELLHLMADQIRCRISEKVRNRSYALLADESRDVAGQEQMSVVLRVIDDGKIKSRDCFIQEFLLGLIPLRSFDAMSLANAIVDLLIKYDIDLNSCIALCFDGASVMGGKHAGVQAILREQYMPKASYIHCHVHRLNLVIADVCVSISYVSEFYSIIKKIHNYFSASSVTNERFQDAQNQLKLIHTSLKPWANIRWDSRWTSIDAILKNYQVIILAFNDLIEDGGERAVDARGLVVVVREPLFVVTLFILHKILGPIKILSDKLKARTLDYGKAQQLILSIIEELNLSRDEKSFEQLFQTITIFCQQNNINLNDRPRQHRRRAISIRFKDSIITSTLGQRDDNLNEQYYRTHIYYQLIDNVLVELRDRFSLKNLHILSSISSLCPDSDTFLHFDSLKPFADHLSFDLGALSNELDVAKPMLQKRSLATIIDLYQELYPFTEAFPTLVALIESAITIPVSSTTCERTFSKMKLIKTTVRNTMAHHRLSDLCLLAVERDIGVNFEQLIDKFSDIHKNSRIMLK